MCSYATIVKSIELSGNLDYNKIITIIIIISSTILFLILSACIGIVIVRVYCSGWLVGSAQLDASDYGVSDTMNIFSLWIRCS